MLERAAMPSIHPTPSRPATPTADTATMVPLRDGPSSSSDTPTSHALTSIDNLPTIPGESIRVRVSTNCGATGGASSAAETQATRYSQALAEWESGGHNDELRG